MLVTVKTFNIKWLLMLPMLSTESCFGFSCQVLIGQKLAAYKKVYSNPEYCMCNRSQYIRGIKLSDESTEKVSDC